MEDEYWHEAQAFADQAPADWAQDQSGELLDNLLPGWIRFRRNGESMTPAPVRDERWLDFSVRRHGRRFREFAASESHLAQAYSLWVAEFAWQLANALNVERFETALDGADAWYHMFDEPLTFRFHKIGDEVVILSDERLDLGWMLVVPQAEFFLGARRFLGSFAVAMSERAPALLTWETFAGLLPYLGETRQSA